MMWCGEPLKFNGKAISNARLSRMTMECAMVGQACADHRRNRWQLGEILQHWLSEEIRITNMYQTLQHWVMQSTVFPPATPESDSFPDPDSESDSLFDLEFLSADQKPSWLLFQSPRLLTMCLTAVLQCPDSDHINNINNIESHMNMSRRARKAGTRRLIAARGRNKKNVKKTKAGNGRPAPSAPPSSSSSRAPGPPGWPLGWRAAWDTTYFENCMNLVFGPEARMMNFEARINERFEARINERWIDEVD